MSAALRTFALCLDSVQSPPTERERQEIALKLAAPHRAPAGRVIANQADAGHLPLFVAANEPRLL